MKKNLIALFLAFTFIFPSLTAAQTATKKDSPAIKAAQNITVAQMRDYLYFISSDEMEGRDTPSRGLDTTAKFIGMNLSRWGFKPAGDDGTYYQKIALLRESSDPNTSTLSVSGETFKYGQDYIRINGSSAAPVSAPLVYGGNGWLIKTKSVDALQNVDVKGKIVVLYSDGTPNRSFLTTPPAGVTREDFAGEQGKDWADPAANAKQKGALGIIVVASNDAQKNWERLAAPPNPRPFVEKFRTDTALPSIVVSQKVGDLLFADVAKTPYKTKESISPLNADKSVSFTAAVKQERVFTQNVVAIWEGSDPVLKNEMVAIGAHYDHVGMNPNAPGEDKIWNGADDDGSGTTGVLAIADALSKSKERPKRSILFVWHTGEEKGLWGSEYFNKFPTVDIKQVTAQLNIDMIGRSRKADDTDPKNKELSDENTIYVIGSNMMSSTLGKIVDETNKNYLKLNYDLRYDDPKDPNRFFFRSDHFNYAVNGIPIAFWFDGVHADYHQPGDTADKIDYNKMEKITRTIFLTLWELSNLKERPKIDKQLPPELSGK